VSRAARLGFEFRIAPASYWARAFGRRRWAKLALWVEESCCYRRFLVGAPGLGTTLAEEAARLGLNFERFSVPREPDIELADRAGFVRVE